MINVKKAQELILKHAHSAQRIEQGAESCALKNASGRILAEDIRAPISHPLFDQSAVDGYAIRYKDILHVETGYVETRYVETLHATSLHTSSLQVIGEIKAGDHPGIRLKNGETVRIFTGAPLPPGTDTVVMQEFVEPVSDDVIAMSNDIVYTKGANIRKKGEQIRKGALALSKGTTLNPAGIGFLASLGIGSVKVACLPKVGIVVTGNEFTLPQNSLLSHPQPFHTNGERRKARMKDPRGEVEAGKIYESNGIMLQSLLQQVGIKSEYERCEDDPAKLKALLQKESDLNDIIIITGGVSVGKYDFTKTALEDIGFEIVFHKVSQKPGKPILFAKKGKKTAFGLPGNPRAVFVCFYEYVFPFIRAIMGSRDPFLPTIQLPLSEDYEKKSERAHFLAAQFNENGIRILDGQGSHMLQSFSEANAVIELPGNKEHFLKGEKVRVYLLPK
ncbi:MAG: molybdopterin molybdotransferase MoeA [Cytophagales bacterium]|nr:molybdopterin molybdotransferase MoeA [Cytophagales bacterium]